EVGHIAQKGGGLMLTSGHTWLYLQSNADEAIILGINLATTPFLEKANAAIKAGLNGAESFDGTVPWSEVKLAAGDAFFGKDEFNTAKNAIGNVGSVTGLVDKGMTFASAAAEIIESSSKVAKFLSKGAKFMKSFGTVMGAAALALDIGLAVTMFFLSGDFSAKAIAMLIAQIVVAVMLFVLGTIPPWIGTVITVVLAIFDLILSFCDACSEFLGISSISGWLTENLADYFYREVQLTELQDYSFLERSNSLADEEMGFVVGNRFVITDTFQGAIKVSGKPGINWSRVKNAAIVAGGTGAIFALADQFDLVGRIFGGPSDKENLQNSWVCGQFVITNKLSSYGNSCPDKTADYELNTIPGDADYWIYENPMDVTVPLNTAQHDFLIQLSTKIVAQTRWDASAPIPPIIGGIPLGRVHWTKERKLTLPDDMNNDQKKQWQITPIYIDVLPATVEGLWDWSRTEPILLNHDPDGDGMSTKDEVNNYLGLNAYTTMQNYFSDVLRPDSPGDLDRILANWDYLETVSFT
ncbi:MAG: hypothetical protein KC419_23585, partial [Anaerolineales bacterium]|nr:hypothetical protein [Anaerolineales bacterium]